MRSWFRPAVAVAVSLAATAPAVGLAMAVTALAGCEGEGAKTALGYTEDARRAYDAAMEEYRSHNWVEAQTLLREVKRKYSYSKYARMAELRIADADYEQEKFSDAIREYKDFIHAHRADADEVSYARARIAESTFAQIPEGALVGAAEERDQASVVDAYKEISSYLADYPSSKEAPHVRELHNQVMARLVRHELYVARFYLGRENYDAAVARIQYALRSYGASGPGPATARMSVTGDSDLEAEALLLLGETYLKMHKWSDARVAFETILRAHGESPIVIQARDYLQHLSERGA